MSRRTIPGVDGIPTIGKPAEPKQPHMIVQQPDGTQLLLPGVAVCVLADNVVEQMMVRIGDAVAKRILDELVKAGILRPPIVIPQYAAQITDVLEVKA